MAEINSTEGNRTSDQTKNDGASDMANAFAPATVSGQQEPNPLLAQQNSSKRKRFSIIALIAIIFILLIGVAAWVFYGGQNDKKSSQAPSSSASSTSKLKFFGNDISRVDCSGVINAAPDKSLLQSSKDKYNCFASGMTVSGEKIKYVNIQLTPEFEQQSQSKCSLDCGFDPTNTPPEQKNVGEFIVRQDGRVERYIGQGGGGLDSLLTDLTGCGSGSTFGINDKLSNGTPVIDSGRFGAASKLSNINVKDNFGNLCTVDLDMVSYLTATSDTWEFLSSVKISKIAIHYDLQNAKSCANQSAPSIMQSCYTAQAILRNDLSLCDNLTSPTPNPGTNPGFDDCVIAVAKKKRDPLLCDKIRYYREQLLADCQQNTKNLKTVFAGEITEK